ncbi:hypothetical protein SYNPS1DRAFT_27505 [Syncephalis pseudoplumigaleata]|uniref:Uncharacterized protein n=1 Tax=Syncephalis pseudoplumigaleata TaxID=1712513 RepID=A0A4P9Z2Q5_9FUNG|nr:hypothetical protein SYNPS1DRAFT_27505 [Syncephalis pseudoplumigaleata]|eukprot:RKP26817.1 hypothetical protein SYNPS1DRAFT_27505 [Syncephalis pseudoplumigaleata]
MASAPRDSRPSGIPVPSRSGTPTQMHRPSGLPRPTHGASTLPRAESRRPSLTMTGSLNSIQAAAMANAVAAANASRIPMAHRKGSMDSGLNGLTAVPAAAVTSAATQGQLMDLFTPSDSGRSTLTNTTPTTTTTAATAAADADTQNNSSNHRPAKSLDASDDRESGSPRIVRTGSNGSNGSNGSGGMVPKSPLTIVREEKSGNVSDDSYEDEEVLAVTGGVTGVDQMRRRTATQTLADFLRTTGPQDYGMAAPRPPSRAQTPVKKRRGLFFRRKKKQPIRTASPAPGGMPRPADASGNAKGGAPATGIPVPSSGASSTPSHIARPMSPAHRGGSWRLRRKFVALIPGLPGQPQLRTRPPSALRNRADVPDRPPLSPQEHGQSRQSLEMMAATNAAKNALLSIPDNIRLGINSPPGNPSTGSPVLAPQSPSGMSTPPIATATMEEPLSPVGKSLTSFQSEFSAALAAFLQRPEGGGMSASSRIAAFQAAYGNIRLEDTYRRKRKVQFSRTDDLIDEATKIPSKAATEQADECDSMDDDDDDNDDGDDGESANNSSADEEGAMAIKHKRPARTASSAFGLKAPKAAMATAKRSSIGVQADLHGLCAQCERRFSQPFSQPSSSMKGHAGEHPSFVYDPADDTGSDIDRSVSPPPAYQSTAMNDFLGMVRTSRRSVRHVQVQTSASCLQPDMVIAVDALAPKPPPPARTDMATQTAKIPVATSHGRPAMAHSPLMALARRHRRLLSDNVSNNSSATSLLLDNGLETEAGYDDYGEGGSGNIDSDASRLAVNVLMSQQDDLRERLETAEELLRIERRDRERLETAMTQARAKFDGVSAQAYKSIRSLMEERRVLMEEVQRLRRFANELLNTSVMAANTANGIVAGKPMQHRRRNSSMDNGILVIDGEVGDDDNYVDA